MASAEAESEQAGAPSAAGASILDVLNHDCWRAVLDHLDIDDIVRSERVSRDWQMIVLDYLEGVRNFKITNFTLFRRSKMDESGRYKSYRRLKLRQYVLYEEMLKKMGRYIETMVTDQMRDWCLIEIGKNCPNLQAITFFRISYRLEIENLAPCKQLKRMVFESCSGYRVHYLNLLLRKGTSVEELAFSNCFDAYGYFIKDFKPNQLKSLQMNKCALQMKLMIEGLPNLTELVKLELNDNVPMIITDLHICLEKMPKLEYLSLNGYKRLEPECGDLLESIGRLGRLKHLSLRGNEYVDDEWLGVIVRGCRELCVLDIGDCEEVSARAVAELCAARAQTLVALVVRGNPNMTDADFTACIASCPNLMSLDVSGCGVTAGLPAAAAGAARGRSAPLRLRVSPDIAQEQVHYNGIIVERDSPPPPSNFEDSDNDDDNYDRYYDSDENGGSWSDRVEEYLESRDVDY